MIQRDNPTGKLVGVEQRRICDRNQKFVRECRHLPRLCFREGFQTRKPSYKSYPFVHFFLYSIEILSSNSEKLSIAKAFNVCFLWRPMSDRWHGEMPPIDLPVGYEKFAKLHVISSLANCMDSLPVELINSILDKTDIRTFLRCQKVSRYVCLLSASTDHLQQFTGVQAISKLRRCS